MPPVDYDRPNETEYAAAVAALEELLDGHAERFPRPGHVATVRRLTRTEYRNAVRDLIGFDVDVEELLPADASSHGFDNVTVGELSPTLLSRYVAVAEQVARKAVGASLSGPDGVTFRLPPDRTQDGHVDGLPFGTRGGGLFTHRFTRGGTYRFRVRLARDRDEKVEGLFGSHELDLLVDGVPVRQFTVEPPQRGRRGDLLDRDFSDVDSHLWADIEVPPGDHDLGVTFVLKNDSLLEIKRQPFAASFNRHRHPRQRPAVLELSVAGPLDDGKVGPTASRERLLTRRPAPGEPPAAAAAETLGTLLRLAYRRPVDASDLAVPLRMFEEGYAEGGYESGIERALTAVLVSPHFLFRVESPSGRVDDRGVYRISDLELASRLSFFLWSSLPDGELLAAAEAGELADPRVLEAQTRRMLADPRSAALVDNFASQWLHLRNLKTFHPDMRRFVDFDDNLRQAMRRETEALVGTVIREDRGVLDLIDPGFTFVNERLAGHYGIRGVRGDHFRRIDSDDAAGRGGLLRHGGVLAVTSYGTRTSPTIRGYWVLKNILGIVPPPPPPDVPDLEEKSAAAAMSLRDRLERHRADVACAGCHDLMDPIGLSLENFDAIGRWRTRDDETRIDASGVLPDGTAVTDVAGLEQFVLKRPEVFVATLAEKLLTFGLGRGLGPADMPAVRAAVRRAAADEYRFSELVCGLVTSRPFVMNTARDPDRMKKLGSVASGE
ncbi:MAG: DUF1592 domain-containing protein [Planctomycetota bacterium]